MEDLVKTIPKNKRARYEVKDSEVGYIERITPLPTSAHSSTFKTLFAKGTIKIDLLASQGADGNFMSRQLLIQIKKSQSSITGKPLISNQIYGDVTGNIRLTCYCTIEVDGSLNLRHGTSLILRKLLWKVSMKEKNTPIIGVLILESLGRDNQTMPSAARDK